MQLFMLLNTSPQTQHLPTDTQFPVQLRNYADNFFHPVEYLLNHVFLANLWEGDFYLLSPLYALALIKHMLQYGGRRVVVLPDEKNKLARLGSFASFENCN